MQFGVIVVTDPQTHKHTQKQTHRQDRLQYTAPLSLARSVMNHPELHAEIFPIRPLLVSILGCLSVGLSVLAEPDQNKEVQLMITNPRDAFRCQARSPILVPLDMLGMFPGVLCCSNIVVPIFDAVVCCVVNRCRTKRDSK